MDNSEIYIKRELTNELQKIQNENKYNFLLKSNIIKNIIGKFKFNPLIFTKFNEIINQYNEEGDLIL